jgi:putative redox protein
MVTITGEYQGDLHCSAVHGPSGTALATDAPKDNQGRGESFSPTDLVATAFATCIATTMAIVGRRHGVDIGRVRYEVTKEMSTDGPRRISRLRARLWMPPAARAVPQGELEKAANACPVHQSLAASIEKAIELIWE